MLDFLNGVAVVVTVTVISTIIAQQSAFGDETAKHRLIDLTHPFDEQTIYWPTEEGFRLEREKRGYTEGGYFYAANRFYCAEHGGTHIDAPYHFAEKGETIDEIPLARLIGPAVCVDVSRKCGADPDYQVRAEDFMAWEKAHHRSLEKEIVLIRTGYGRHWPNREKYLGTAESGEGAVAKLHFPGLDPIAADWLVSRRHVPLVGIDTASIDHGQSEEYGSHVRLFRDNVPALENVAGLDDLPPHGFTLIALPMKIAGGSGAPCRIVAIVPTVR